MGSAPHPLDLALVEQREQLQRFLPLALARRLRLHQSLSEQDRRSIQEHLARLLDAMQAALPRWVSESGGRENLRALADVTLLAVRLEVAPQAASDPASTGVDVLGLLSRRAALVARAARAWGGDVLSLDGATALCMFQGEGHALAAASAAWDLQAAVGQQAEGGVGPAPLWPSVGLASGPLLLLGAGTARRRVPLALGQVVARAQRAASAGRPGGTVLDAGTAAVARGWAALEPLEGGGALLLAAPGVSRSVAQLPLLAPVHTRSDDLLHQIVALAPYLAPDVLAILSGDEPLALLGAGERRHVVALRARLDGLHTLADQQGTAQAAAVARLASALIDAVLEAVEGSGGALVSASSSAGGLDLLALFGAPIAHEHDGLSAVRAALELQAHLGGLRAREAALPLAFVGLEAGVAAAGLIGTPDRFVYAITGEVAADSATQLEWAAQLGELTVAGPVLCERLGDLLIVEERGAEAGEAAPARLLRGLRGSVSPRQPRCGALVGRERELRQIAAALDALRTGRRRVLVLQGEAGVGKSRLTQELIARAGAEASCLVTEAQGRAPTSYSLFRELLRMLCGLPQEASPTLVFRRLYSTLERLTPAREAELWPALGGLLGLPTADQGFAAQHSATRQRALAAATVALLEAAARRQPLIWICEDLHEADTASLALLEQVLSLLGEVPLLFCATLRPHPVARELDRHPAHATVAATVRSLGAAAAVLQIEPLGGADRARLLDALLPELPAMLRDTLSEQSGGNPLFLELLAESLGQRADTLAANGRSAHVVGRSLPPTLRQLIAAQIDLLPVEVRQFAHVAAVIATVDRVFPHWLLERVTDRPQSTDPRLAELLRARVIEQVPGQPARHYRFRHGLVQSAIYERLLAGERDALHRRIGLVLHYLEPEQREARLDALAYHCYEGKLPELALAYSLRAGRRAQQTYANREARQAFRRALGLARRLGALQQEADAREGLGELYALQGELSPARAQFERALRLGAALDADDAQVEAQARRRRLLSLVSEQAGDYAEAEAHCRNGLVLAASLATPSTETARLYAQLAGVLWRRADYAAADRACREGLAALPPAPAALSERVLLLQRQATIAGERGNFGEAVEELEQSLGLARLAADPAPLGAVLHNLGMYLDATGDVTRALACYRESLAIKERIGDAPGRVLTVGNLGVLYLKAGDYAAAERCFVEARDISQRLGLHGPHADAMVNLGHLELMVGKLHEAGGHFEAAWAIFAALDDAGSVAHCLYMLGDVALNQAQAQRASQYAEQSLALARQIQSLALEACALRVLGEASLDQGRLDSAAAQLETAWQIQERLGEPYDQAMVLAARARLALARHDRVLAQDLARRALALARAQSIPFLISRLEALQTLAARAV